MRYPHRFWLAGFVTGVAALHFVSPRPFERIVPRALGSPRLWVDISGVAELAAGALLAVPATRRIGGWAVATVLVAVFPANVQMALDGGLEGGPGILGSPVAAWLRLPLQVPLVLWAVHEARSD